MKSRLFKLLNSNKSTAFFIFFVIFSLSVSDLMARAGGGGGSRSGSSHSSSSSRSSSYSSSSSSHNSSHSSSSTSTSNPLPSLLIFAGVCVAFIGTVNLIKKTKEYLLFRYSVYKKNKQMQRLSSRAREQIRKFRWDVNLYEFEQKVHTAFLKIQNAWSNKSFSEIRQFISDGVYRRFSVQFEMMNLLEQTNELSNIAIHSLYPVLAEEDGPFDIIHVYIEASMDDRFICRRDESLNSGGIERFVEYWSFIRSHGSTAQKDIYSEKKCPACSGPLPDKTGESCVCEYCKTVINSGDFDWILAEITQEMDWKNREIIRNQFRTDSNWRQLQKTVPDLSIQRIEDLASNAFVQIIAAHIATDTARVQYLCSDKGFSTINNAIPLSNEKLFKDTTNGNDSLKSVAKTFLSAIKKDDLADKIFGQSTQPLSEKGQPVLNRFYLSDVSIINAETNEEYVRCTVSISALWQASVLFKDGSLTKIHYSPIENDFGICLSRKKNVTKCKGELMVHRCPACGATLSQDSFGVCSYCRTKVNSPDVTWVVDQIYNADQLSEFIKTLPHSDYLTDKYLYLPTKYIIFKNLAIIALVDGSITKEEENLLNRYRRKLMINKKWAQEQIGLARSGRLRFVLPPKKSQQKQLFKKMEALVAVDSIDPAEREYIQLLKNYYDCQY